MTRTRTMVVDSQTITPQTVTQTELYSWDKKIRFVNCDLSAKNVIYKITTFPQKRMYIGSTTRNLSDRVHDHCKDAMRSPSRLVCQAIRECESIEVSTIFAAPNTITRKELQGIEKAYIRDLRDRILFHLPTNEHHLIGHYLLNMNPDGRYKR